MRKFVILLAALSCAAVLFGCSKAGLEIDATELTSHTEQRTASYSFSGENEYIRISDGSIVYGEQNESFNGGNLEILQPDLFTNVHSYSTTFYTLLNNGQRNAFHSTTATGVTDGADSIISNLGNSSSNGFMIFNLNQGLWFELTTTAVNGTENAYLLELTVTEDRH